jgi:Leucine-rich repeat (LRR) protein
MLDVCEDLSDNIRFTSTIHSKCGYSLDTINSNWDKDNGVWSGDLSCNSKHLTDSDLDAFKVLKKVTSILRLSDNQLTDLNGLSNLISVNELYLNNNQLTNVNGLSNLTSVGSLSLYYNQLTDISGLSNLTANKLYIPYNSTLKDISPLATANITSLYIENSDNPYTTKIAKDSDFCTTTRDIYRGWNTLVTMLDVCED